MSEEEVLVGALAIFAFSFISMGVGIQFGSHYGFYAVGVFILAFIVMGMIFNNLRVKK